MFWFCGIKNTIKQIQEEQKTLNMELKNLNEKYDSLKNLIINQQDILDKIENKHSKEIPIISGVIEEVNSALINNNNVSFLTSVARIFFKFI
jgi:predicted  nucleic acid-binding Zn-ribbon protein